ncbi:hypothetical protein ACFQIB_08350 [Jeongeupia naejangsanensis]|uniref:Uncharacterized protein n=1 Tax=Jeongeupia naejangsanensis TaxID=613195 RepID=A0ABS2BPI7_9NEIS|nr:hypothetical protein [Jeongeupia naejangsanensis]MBM3117513.1 hypothetical protein [Jeongeupia naejangsanensis]
MQRLRISRVIATRGASHGRDQRGRSSFLTADERRAGHAMSRGWIATATGCLAACIVTFQADKFDSIWLSVTNN